MQTTTIAPLGTITGPPYVTLVDLEGFAVGTAEKGIPEPFGPDPSEWPDWTDAVRYELGATFDDVIEGDDTDPGTPSQATPSQTDDDEDWVDLSPSVPPDEESDTGEFETIPAEPPAGWKGSAAAGWVLLPPISGGCDFEPGPADLADYATWSEELDRRRATESYLAGFNEQRQDWTEVPA